MTRTIWTMGHSTHTLEAFVALLRQHGITAAVDVRAFPGSRVIPTSRANALKVPFPRAGIDYTWLGRELGGRRRSNSQPSLNTALRNESFRNFADFMTTLLFEEGIDRLLQRASKKSTAFFCAELLWWRCHRSLISDYLTLARGWEVRHIIDLAEPKEHKVKPEAHLSKERLIYAEPDLFTPLRGYKS